jgi:hypothetical protein
MLGSGFVTVGSLFVSDGFGVLGDAGKAGEISDDALILRGGGLANQSKSAFGRALNLEKMELTAFQYNAVTRVQILVR